MLQGQHGLDQSGYSGRRFQVPHVRFHRTNGTESTFLRLPAKHLRERGDLHRVTQGCAGAVRLDITDALGMHSGCGLR